MKYNNFEKHISESFLHDSAAVDTDALIASLGIPVSLEPKKKVAWWLLTGLALVSLVVMGLYYFVNGSMVTNEGGMTSETLIPSMKEGNNKSTVIVAEYDESTKEVIVVHDIETIEYDGNTKSVENKSKELNSKIGVGTVLQNETKTNEIQSNYQNAHIKGEVVLLNEWTVAKNQVSSDLESDLASVSKTNTNVLNDSKFQKDVIEEVSVAAEVNKLIEPLLPINALQSGAISKNNTPWLSEPECPSFSYRIPWNIALLAEVGLMKPMKDLNNIGGSNTAFELRDINENSKEAIQLGLHVKVSKGNNPLYVRGGAAYTRIAEQMNEEYDYIELDTMRGLISITTSMTGDTVTAIYGDVVSETRYTGRSEKHYFIHLLDIPVAIGYEVPVGGSFYVGAELGVQFNLRTSGSGYIFRDVNDYADFSEVSTKETKVGMSYFGGFHFGKHLSKRSSVQLSARFRYYPSRFSSVDPSIEQRYNLAGIHAGYVWRF